MAFLEVRNLSKSFPSPAGVRHVLKDVTLDVDQGEFVSIVGTMGSGKSTLLSLLAGLTSPDGGTVVLDGKPVTGVRDDAAFVFQNYSLLPWFSALENVRLAVQAAFPTEAAADQKRRATEALERVGLGNALDRKPRQLSGGMRQRVSLARAFATEPRVLFLDEPFGALDALTRDTLQQDLAELCAGRERPVTTVMITNSVEEAILLSDRIVPIVTGPPASLGVSIPVELGRPRTLAQLAHDEQATHARAHVVAALTASMARRNRSVSATALTALSTAEPVKEAL
ncbi:MAG TPA: ABC transporter ATP-binding protein [Vicinamibacterales bacterium]|jgi:nitrate/nitrite transport system ATP-binding protein|nr:ABC transporter ATP-binding protein [Vicinamibacterales bacterium]